MIHSPEKSSSFWDGTGLWVMAKQLAQGRFCRPQGLKTKSTKVALKPDPLEILLNSIDLKDGLQRVWYETLLTQEATST